MVPFHWTTLAQLDDRAASRVEPPSPHPPTKNVALTAIKQAPHRSVDQARRPAMQLPRIRFQRRDRRKAGYGKRDAGEHHPARRGGLPRRAVLLGPRATDDADRSELEGLVIRSAVIEAGLHRQGLRHELVSVGVVAGHLGRRELVRGTSAGRRALGALDRRRVRRVPQVRRQGERPAPGAAADSSPESPPPQAAGKRLMSAATAAKWPTWTSVSGSRS